MSAAPDAVVPNAPVTIGINWYTNFDSPVRVGRRWWIGLDQNLGSIRGGHCVCIRTASRADPTSWWSFYDQGREGACVGFGSSRMMSLLNRKRYDARWLWNKAKEIDEWPDTNPGDDNGTSVRAGMEVLRTQGLVRVHGDTPDPTEGIAAYRWATTVDEVRQVLASPLHDKLQAFPVLNSWGRGYPHEVWLPYDKAQRVFNEDGEVALVSDR
jgi:hypothetical protein